MKMDMTKWDQEWHAEAGLFTAKVTGAGESEATNKSGVTKRFLYISFDIRGKKYVQRYYLKDGVNNFFTKDCIKIMGGSERVLSPDFDTDEMIGIAVEIDLGVWGEQAQLTINGITRTTPLPNNHLRPTNTNGVPF